jgi:hypothetical protein
LRFRKQRCWPMTSIISGLIPSEEEYGSPWQFVFMRNQYLRGKRQLPNISFKCQRLEPNRFLKTQNVTFLSLQTVKRCQPYVPIFWTQCSCLCNMANKNNGDIGFFGI